MSQPTLASEFQAMADALAQVPPIPSLSIADARAMWKAYLPGEREPIGEISEMQFANGDTTLAARLYRPAGECNGVILFIHGGGWVLGDIETHDIPVTGLVRRSGCALLSVNYRLAPEAPFPGPLEDCYAALEWLAAEREALGLAGLPLFVCGDSAGGNLAAALAILARDQGGARIDGQVLLDPATDGRRSLAAYAEHGSGGLLSAADMEWFWNHYAPGPQALDPLASPLLHANLAGLPPAIVVIAEFDPLRDDGLEYAARLQEAGVACTTIRFDDLPHGFLTSYQLSPSADRAVTLIAQAVRELAAASMTGSGWAGSTAT